MLKLWNVFSDIPAKLKYFLNFTQGVLTIIVAIFWLFFGYDNHDGWHHVQLKIDANLGVFGFHWKPLSWMVATVATFLDKIRFWTLMNQ